MTEYEALVAGVTRWLDDNDRERDDLAREIAWEVKSDVERGCLRGRLAFLERERVRALDTLERLKLLANRPEVLFSQRPKFEMAKASLPPTQERKATA